MTLADRQAAIADLLAHPGYRALLDDFEFACDLVLQRMRDADSEAKMLQYAREWQALARLFAILRETPQELRREIEERREQSDDPFRI